MKNKLFLFISFIVFLSCGDKTKYKNPYLQEVSFSRDINIDLPEYSSLKFSNNSVLIHNIGIKGVLVFNTGSGYTAYEASDPNHYPSNCSQMQPNQFTCKCNCEENQYSLYTGQLTQGNGEYSLKPYHVSKSGNILHIYN